MALATLTTSLCGCAVGPLMSHESARTVGEKKIELAGGLGQAGYVLKWTYGVSENFDLGVHWESLSIGLRAKYAFLNQKQGWSSALAGGIGTSVGGSHYYGDAMLSYAVQRFEPYGTLRVVHVKTNPVEFKDKDTGYVHFTVDRFEYEYGQVFLGTRYWFNEQWMLSVEASSLFALTTGLGIGNNILLSGAVGCRF